MKTCRTCTREFNPSSRHRDCPACRGVARKHPCETCGEPCGFAYKTCGACVNKRQAGENNPRWKGGRTKHKNGYIMVNVPDHPRHVSSKSNYVFEHILVMEDILGRYLLPGENVHHLNGVRDDNRPENLELWTKPQPAGIRASDALAWAYEIIELYGVPPRLQQTSTQV